MNRYLAFGMSIRSDISLFLPADARDGRAGDETRESEVSRRTVDIRRAKVPRSDGLPHSIGNLSYGSEGGDLRADVRNLARFRIRGDSLVEVEPLGEFREQYIGLYICGFILPALLRRSECLTLHGSAVSGKNGALVFLGRQGSGKSTTAAALARIGYDIMCDDVVPIAPGPVVQPGIARLKLLPDAFEAFAADALPHLHDGVDKLQVDFGGSHAPAPLRAVFILEPGAGGAEIHGGGAACLPGAAGRVGARKLGGMEKVKSVYSHVSSIEGIDDPVQQFSRVPALLASAPVFSVSRPGDADSIAEVAETIARIDESARRTM